MVYKSVRGWTSGRSLPVLNFVKYPPGVLSRFTVDLSVRYVQYVLNCVISIIKQLSYIARAH